VARLATEQVNPASRSFDTKSALEIARIMNSEDAKVARKVKRVLPTIARAIDVIADALRKGGRLIYVGTGTSGRMAALDAVECPPTFNVDAETVQFILAGGPAALAKATEADEDSSALGRREMLKRRPGPHDVVVGIAASGRTPFTVAALAAARRRGATTIALTCNHRSPLERTADLAIVVVVGPEVISGSTRLKAATAHKMVLNMLSTGAMTRLGHVYGNLMSSVRRRNSKLRERAVTVVAHGAGLKRPAAVRALSEADGNASVALVMARAGVTRADAARALTLTGGNVRQAIARARLE